MATTEALEALIKKDMEILGITRDEAIAMIASDAKIDKMTSTTEIDSDLSKDQKANAKKARQADRKPGVYKLDATAHKRKENTEKQSLISCLENAVKQWGAKNVEIVNNEREITFKSENALYKITLSCPRK